MIIIIVHCFIMGVWNWKDSRVSHLFCPAFFTIFAGSPPHFQEQVGWGPRLGTPPSLVQMCVVAIRVVLKDVLRVAPRVVPQVVPRVVQLVPAGSPSDDTSTDGGSASILRPLSSDFPFIFLTFFYLCGRSFIGQTFADVANLCLLLSRGRLLFICTFSRRHTCHPSPNTPVTSVTLATLVTSVTPSYPSLEHLSRFK